MVRRITAGADALLKALTAAGVPVNLQADASNNLLVAPQFTQGSLGNSTTPGLTFTTPPDSASWGQIVVIKGQPAVTLFARNASDGSLNNANQLNENDTTVVPRFPVMPAKANASTPTWAEGAFVPASVTLQGRQRIQQFADRRTNNTGIDAFVDSVAPHTLTNRLSYTVPANQIAVVRGVAMSVERETAATVAGIITADVRTASGATRLLSIRTSTNSPLARIDKVLAPAFELPAGEQIFCEDTDASTGGTVSFDYNVIINEYSA